MSWGAFAYGSAAFGGAAVIATTVGPTYTHGLNVRLYVGGQERTGQMLNDGLRITDELSSRTQCSFGLKDDTKSLRVEIGSVVRVTLDEWPIFAGTIDEISEKTAGDFSDVNLLDISAVDWSQLADRHIVATRFDTEGQTLRDVVLAIVNTQSGDPGERLVDEGVTTDGVQVGPVLSTVSFDYETAAKAFDQLAELTGYTWYIDANKQLMFFERATFYAPYELDDAKWTGYRNLKFKRTREKYRNFQYLLAGSARTNARTESFKGDGENRTFTLSMPCAEKPTLSINGVAVDPGIIDTRVNDEDQKDIEWFWKQGDKQISQNSDSDLYTALGDSVEEILAVTYKGEYPIAAITRADSEISARKAAESDFGASTGVYCDVERDDSIDDLDMGIERALGLLRRYARIEATCDFETDIPGFRRGQIIKVNQPEFGATSEYLITRCEFQYVADTFMRYRISAIDGEDMGGWADYFKRLSDHGRPFVIGDNDAINLVRQRSSGIIIGDRVSTTDPLQDWSADPATYIVWGLSKIGGRKRLTPDADDELGVVFGPMIGMPLHGPQVAYAGIATVGVMGYDAGPPAFGTLPEVTVEGLDAAAENIAASVPLTFAGFEQDTDWEVDSPLMDNCELVSSPARTGNGAVRCYPSGTTDGSVEFATWDSTGWPNTWNCATVYSKFHVRIDTLPATGKTEQVAGWWDQSFYIKGRLHVDHDGHLLLYNKQGTDTLVATGSTTLNTSQWYRIEAMIGTGVSAGYEVKIDGASEFSGNSDFGTSNHAMAWLGRTSYGFTSDDSVGNFYFDDVSFDSGTWIGDSKVLQLFVDGDGYHTGWAASAGDKYACVQETTPNNDSDYISSSTANAVYTATCESCAAAGISGTIRAAMGVTWCKKLSGSTTKIKTRVRSGTTDSDLTTFATLSSTEYWATVLFLPTDPATGSAWNTTALDAAEVGPLKENNTLGVRCTMAAISVEFKP